MSLLCKLCLTYSCVVIVLRTAKDTGWYCDVCRLLTLALCKHCLSGSFHFTWISVFLKQGDGLSLSSCFPAPQILFPMHAVCQIGFILTCCMPKQCSHLKLQIFWLLGFRTCFRWRFLLLWMCEYCTRVCLNVCGGQSSASCLPQAFHISL